jgi:glycoprotein endo-alpha-1,2-mannosidase
VRILGLVLAALVLLVPCAHATTAKTATVPTTAVFYYPWFGNPAHDGAYDHWQQNGHAPDADIASAYYPSRGAYSSGDPSVLDAQMREIERARIGEIVVSWWGRDSSTDERLPGVIAAARKHSIEVAAHLEPYAGRSITSVTQDVAYLRSLGISDVFVYHATDFTAAEWQPLTSSLSGVRLFAQTPLAGYAKTGGFQGIYTYDTLTYRGRVFARMCTAAHKQGLLCAPSVGPGYSAERATGDARSVDRANGRTYDSMWNAAIRAGADLTTITSYNEWNEGTQIEAACVRTGYATYDGAWGLRGDVADLAYINRTRYWISRFVRQRLGGPQLTERH